MGEFLHHYKEILTDPAHLAVEVTLMLLVDVLFLGVIWPFVVRRIRHEHLVIDEEHGIDHDEQEGGYMSARSGVLMMREIERLRAEVLILRGEAP